MYLLYARVAVRDDNGVGEDWTVCLTVLNLGTILLLLLALRRHLAALFGGGVAVDRNTETTSIDSSATDEELVVRAIRGDAEAFESLIIRYQKPALRVARRFTGNTAEAEDLAQDAFLQVYRCAHQFNPNASFKIWFFAIIGNLCRNAIKRRRLFSGAKPPEDRAAPDDPVRDLTGKEQSLALTSAIRNLPPNQRLAFTLCHYEEMSYAEAAAALGLSVKAVESLLVRAKRNLRRELAPLMSGPGARKKIVD